MTGCGTQEGATYDEYEKEYGDEQFDLSDDKKKVEEKKFADLVGAIAESLVQPQPQVVEYIQPAPQAALFVTEYIQQPQVEYIQQAPVTYAAFKMTYAALPVTEYVEPQPQVVEYAPQVAPPVTEHVSCPCCH